MPRIKAVIFDLDDTLYPERAFAFSGFAAVAKAFVEALGNPGKAQSEMQRLFDTQHRRRVFNEVLRGRGLSEDTQLLTQMIETYREHTPSIALYADAAAALARLRPRFRLGLITDGPERTQSAKIAALGIADSFDSMILTGHWPEGFAKPHPRAFEETASRLGVAHAECAYIADNPAKDFVAPIALGWLTIRIRREQGIYIDTPAAPGGEARHVVDSLQTIDEIIERA